MKYLLDSNVALKWVLPEADSGKEQRNFRRLWWQERHRAARRVFNVPVEVEKIVEILEEAGGRE